MFRFGFIGRILLSLILIGLLVGGGMALYRYGFAQGYQAGAVTVTTPNQGGTPQTPYPYYGYGPYHFYPGFGGPFFFPFFPLVGIGFFLLFFFLIGGLFRMGGRGRWHGYGGPGWGYGPGPRPGEGEKESGNPPPGPNEPRG